ncbi:hypothetical protein FNYG_15706 [Fusarium nygamai]|uniref:Malonyl-CoA:ACP transacylase (MAT) domain-containing protein n=1 Tax=Gibberella nygamai TaxID=42673 RepID=A0A2K0U7T7_GIBNY|nr:hypothetical protein FNYG_15706 [Fusarium nygamai]
MAIAHHRSVLSADKDLRVSVKGGLVAVGVGSDDAEAYIEQLRGLGKGKACIACINSPRSVTIRGDLSAVLEVEVMAKSDGVLTSRLNVDIGYHSHQMEPISHRYREALSKPSFTRHQMTWIQSSTPPQSPVAAWQTLKKSPALITGLQVWFNLSSSWMPLLTWCWATLTIRY